MRFLKKMEPHNYWGKAGALPSSYSSFGKGEERIFLMGVVVLKGGCLVALGAQPNPEVELMVLSAFPGLKGGSPVACSALTLALATRGAGWSQFTPTFPESG